MIKVQEAKGRVMLECQARDVISCEVMDPTRARELAHEITKLCDRLQNWTWEPGGGPVAEPVIHIDNHWYDPQDPKNLPTAITECLVTTEGFDGRHVSVALFIPAYGGKPERWTLPVSSFSPDGQTSLQKIIAWCPMPRPAGRKA